MDTRQLRYFSAIYDHGALSRASDELRVAVSALSHHLANLEADLGSKLFERMPRGLRPTAAGERLYAHAQGILRSLSSAELDIKSASENISGELAVGMAHSAVKAIAVPLLTRVLNSYPDLRLSLSESLSGSTLIHLLSSEIDLAVVYNPPSDARLRTQAVLEEDMVCVGKREIIGSTDEPISFEEVLALPIIILRQGLSARALLDDTSLLKRLEASAQLQMNSVYAIAASLNAGLGCVIGTKLFMQEHIESGALHHRPIIEPQLTRTLYLCELSDRPPTFASEKIRKLVLELISEAITEGRWEARTLLT